MLWQKVYHLHHFAGFLYFWNNIPGDSLGSHDTSRTSRARRCHRRVWRSDELEPFAGLELLDVLWVLFMLFREDEVLKLLGFQAFQQISTWTKNISQTNRNLNRKHHIKSPKTSFKEKTTPTQTDQKINELHPEIHYSPGGVDSKQTSGCVPPKESCKELGHENWPGPLPAPATCFFNLGYSRVQCLKEENAGLWVNFEKFKWWKILQAIFKRCVAKELWLLCDLLGVYLGCRAVRWILPGCQIYSWLWPLLGVSNPKLLPMYIT